MGTTFCNLVVSVLGGSFEARAAHPYPFTPQVHPRDIDGGGGAVVVGGGAIGGGRAVSRRQFLSYDNNARHMRCIDVTF